MPHKQTIGIRARQMVTGVLVGLLFIGAPVTVAAETVTPAPDTQTNQSVAEPSASASASPAAPSPAAEKSTTEAGPTPAAASPTPSSPAQTTATGEAEASAQPTPATTATPAPNAQTAEPAPGNTVNISHKIDSTATSGNAAVIENDTAGNATSGQASASATLVNVVGYSNGLGNGTPATTFVQDIYNAPGSNEIQGNIIIDPNNLSPTATNAQIWYNPNSSVVGSNNLTNITNDVTLTATSGSADVLNNDTAGNASTGDATAMANIINVVNSSVGARNSFLGVVNIHGNLRGDILVPASLIDSLFSSNGTPTQALAANASSTSLTDNVNITNNVDLAAVSGEAAVTDNGTTGNATSGDATTKLTVFNLTGQQVIAKNSLLVFVNVAGQWVGMIMNAPAGSTAAAFTGNGSSAATATPSANTGIAANNTVNITNNVKVAATSGNATVAGNGQAGDATSGNATASANILNLVHSSFSLDDWFGVLFINVLGSWLGNFGIAATPAPGGNGQPLPNSDNIQAIKVFQFNGSTAVSPVAKPAPQPSNTTVELADTETVATTQVGEVLSANSNEGGFTDIPQDAGARSLTSIVALLAGLFILAGTAVSVWRRRGFNR